MTPGNRAVSRAQNRASIRVGCVRYLNTVPLIEGLERVQGFELDAAVPARIIDLLIGPPPREPSVDIGLISIIDGAASPVPLTLIPAGMIGCDGPTLTVRLFSQIAFDRVERVHADTDSHTSVALARVLLAAQYGARPEVVGFDARERVAEGARSGGGAPVDPDESWPETLLLIGDKVVTDSPPAVRYPHQLDLGEAWKALTGLPFMYACWACRREDRERAEIVGAASILDRQRRRNAARLDWVVARRAREKRWPGDLARRYLGELLRFEVTPDARRAAQMFITLASEEGLLPASAPTTLDWLELPVR